MKRRNIILTVSAAVLCTAAGIWLLVRYLHNRPEWIQGRVECPTCRAATDIAGRIERLPVKEGQRVAKGELLCTVSSPELELLILHAEQARDIASAIDCVLEVDAQSELERAALRQWQEAQAGEELARKHYEHIERLCRSGEVTQDRCDKALAALKHMCSVAESARLHHKLIQSGRPKQSPDTSSNPINPSALMGQAVVCSPVDGEVAALTAHVGEFVGLGAPVVILRDTSERWVQCEIPETLLPRFRIGTALSGYIPALDCTADLKVAYITPKDEIATHRQTIRSGTFEQRTFLVRLDIAPIPALSPGMSVLIDRKRLPPPRR